MEHTDDQFMRARVVDVIEEGVSDFSGVSQPFQRLRLEITSGGLAGGTVEVEHGSLFPVEQRQLAHEGQTLVLTRTQGPEGEVFVVTDTFRLAPLIGFVVVLAIVMRILSGRSAVRALSAVLLGIGLLVVGASEILSNPLNIETMLAFGSAGALIFALGVSRTPQRFILTTLSVFAALVVTAGFAVILMGILSLSGVGAASSLLLQFGGLDQVGAERVFVFGLLVVATGFSSYIAEMQVAYVGGQLAKRAYSWRELLFENMATMSPVMNKTFLMMAFAMVGVSLPLYLLFGIDSQIPFWVTANSEFIVQELARVLVVGVFIYLSYVISTVVAKLGYSSVFSSKK